MLASSNALDFSPYPPCDERGPLEDAGPMTLFTSNLPVMFVVDLRWHICPTVAALVVLEATQVRRREEAT